MLSARRAEPLLSESLAAPARIEAFADSVFDAGTRRLALERFLQLPSGRERTGHYWRIDLDAISLDGVALDPNAGSVSIECADRRVRIGDAPAVLGLSSAALSKFGSLALAFANRYAFITVPAGVDVEQPIVITYRAAAGEAIFPYTCVHVERGARASIVERLEAAPGAFVAGILEIVTEETSDLSVATYQDAAADARILATRHALPGKDARLALAGAEMGGALVVSDINASLLAGGSDVRIAELFFPNESQHVDVRSNVEHRAAGATSLTTVKSAATGRGQARYVGNIRIAAQAQKSDASLRDDALILSRNAHIDSVPALEIAANDVKAYHGATVGALDAETLFYMTTRGIERDAAERMVTLGFFESGIEQFPAMLRDELRNALEAKVR